MRRILCLPFLFLLVFATLCLSNFATSVSSTSVCNIDVFSESEIYKTRYQLLIETLDYVGVCSPENAAEVWANGLMMRNAAMQYAMMTRAYKDKYLDKLGLDSNFVTGQSSPSIMSFSIEKINLINSTNANIVVKFEIGSPSTISKFYYANLSIIKENNFWRISTIEAPNEIVQYTGQ
jgi:hypothetical protein